jgi:TolB-like protein/class 3 adenylate cyclase/thioredoxin-like negative regulator of GroEL
MLQRRHLAAILFTDIVGYTAMMQQDEVQTMALVRRYLAVLQTSVKAHAGDILNDYGDGSLCIFSSVIEAVRAALELQQKLKAEPAVPLRIGLHIGEIFYEDGKVFGDAVNIASRIQSLGQANTVLFSGEINNKISNQPEFRSVSLGRFEFKNVAEPIEVFALANEGLSVPKRKEITGKLKEDSRKFSKKRMIPVTAILLLAFIALFVYNKFISSPGFTGKEKSIAVLPFSNLSAEKENEYFSDGITEEIITQLSKISELKVIARTSSSLYKNSKKSIRQTAKELRVASILEGSVQKSGDKVRISVQLIDANTEKNIWADRFDRELLDIFTIQSEVATHIAAALETRLFAEERKQIGKKETGNPEAYNLYLKGRYYLNKGTEEDLYKALQHFDQAIEKDSSYAKAYSGMADAYLMLGEFEYLAGVKAWPNAEIYARKALSLDDALADAHNSLGHLSIHRYNWPTAEKELKRAIELSPTHAEAHHFMSQYFAAMGRMKESITEVLKALELDPLSLLLNSNTGQQYYRARHYKEAEEYLKKTIEMQPGYPRAHRNLARVYMVRGMYRESIAEFEKALVNAKDNPTVLGYLGYAYGRYQEKQKAQQVLNNLKKPSGAKNVAGEIALVYIGLGEKDLAFEWLDRAIQELSTVLLQIKVDPEFDAIRDDPRYHTVLKRMGLE